MFKTGSLAGKQAQQMLLVLLKQLPPVLVDIAISFPVGMHALSQAGALQVPPAWLKAYPSLKALGPWTRDLLQRLDQLRQWIDKGYPICYWLAGFTYPTAFLTAVLQVHFFLTHCKFIANMT